MCLYPFKWVLLKELLLVKTAHCNGTVGTIVILLFLEISVALTVKGGKGRGVLFAMRYCRLSWEPVSDRCSAGSPPVSSEVMPRSSKVSIQSLRRKYVFMTPLDLLVET